MSNMINKVAFDFIYNEALNDSTRRTDAASIKNEILKYDTAKDVVYNYAQRVIEGKMPDFYEYEEKFENELSKAGITGFTFGNIQKLINMTMKHLYINYYDKIRENFECCHAPMDSRMIEIVGKMYRKMTGRYLGISECAWSTIQRGNSGMNSLKSYAKYQDAIDSIVKEKMYRIEFDFYMWCKDPKKKDELVLPNENVFVETIVN